MAGIIVGDRYNCSLLLAGVALSCVALAAVKFRRTFLFALLIALAFLIRHQLDWQLSPGRFPLTLAARDISIVRATGIVTSDPASAGFNYHGSHVRFECHLTNLSWDSQSVSTNFPVEIDWSGPAPVWGDQISVQGSISPPAPAHNPGEFDYAEYLARRGIFAELTCGFTADNRIIDHNCGNPVITWGRNARAWIQQRLARGIDDDTEISGLIQTITLGLKQQTSYADRDLFQQVGALHLFVVNGLHIGLLAFLLTAVLKFLRIYRRSAATILIPILLTYALVTGLSPGSVRAAIMAAVFYGATFVERRAFSLNSLAAAGLILLLWDTNELFQEGFQFSFGVVAAIILLADLIQKPILPLGLPDPFIPRRLWTRLQRLQAAVWERITTLAGISTAASIGAFPFSAAYFNISTPTGLLANIFLVPIAGGILGESIFSLITSWSNSLSLLFNNSNWLLGWAMLACVHLFAWIPCGHFFVSIASSPRPHCEITILDLGPGQAILIETRGQTWLVDCGNNYTYSRIVRPFLESRGINRLDGFIISHGAAPSMGAASSLISDFSPRQIGESSLTDRSSTRKTIESALDISGSPKVILESGDHLDLGSGCTCEVLYPPAGLDARTASDKSLVLQIQYGTNRILLMSDSAYTGEHWLIDNSHDLAATGVVLGGLSTDLAGTDAFLSAAHPAFVIRGEPPDSAGVTRDHRWFSDVSSQKISTFLQSDTGAVIIDLTDSGVSATGFVNRQRFTRRSE